MPFMRNGKRDYQAEKAWDHKHPQRIKDRAARNLARAHAEAKGLVHKGDKKQVDHIQPLSKGGSHKDSNTRVLSDHANESYPRNKDGSMATVRKGRRGRG